MGDRATRNIPSGSRAVYSQLSPPGPFSSLTVPQTHHDVSASEPLHILFPLPAMPFFLPYARRTCAQGQPENPSLCASCSPPFWEEFIAPSGGSNRGLAMPQVCQSSGQESTSPPGKGPVEGRDMPGALWILSTEAGRAATGGALRKGW